MRRLLIAVPLLVFLLAVLAPSAYAWKPFTHNYTGTQAAADVADGTIRIAGNNYSVPPKVVAAVNSWPQYFNAGVIGPDGFPDLVMGQSVIHPEETGKWLEYILGRAWDAQNDASYTPDQRGQILAFGYGFLVHAAGDMWAHTIVNESAAGVFPGPSEFVKDNVNLEIAIRHVIIEGYLGDATPGYDGNDDRTTLPNGDVSDDSTTAVAFAAPKRWIYETLVDPQAAGAPTSERGVLLDFFIDLEAGLQVQKARFDFDKNHADCLIIDPDCFAIAHSITVNTIKGPRTTTVTTQDCIGATVGCAPSLVDAADDLILNNIGSAYLGAWIADIQDGLENWSDVGLALTRGLFDPQARRDLQNAECSGLGSETTQARIDCEDGISKIDVILHELDPFITNHLLSMMGAPDAVGDVVELAGVIGDAIDDLLGPALNPLRIATADLKEAIKELIKDGISQAIGMDIDQLEDFLLHPTAWLDVQSVTLTMPFVGPVTLNLFPAGTHARLDGYLGFTGTHHAGGIGTQLADDAVTSQEALKPLGNTITMAKLLFLEGSQLNKVLGDILTARGVILGPGKVTTYRAEAVDPLNKKPVSNIMYQPLSGTEPWLELIDGDHAWRANGLPVFCDPGNTAQCAEAISALRPTGATERLSGPDFPSQLNAGNGTFPIWESCLLRPAFRTLFSDWENGTLQFPALGDGTSPDPSDPAPPGTDVQSLGTTYVQGGTTYINGSNSLKVTATDLVFTPAKLNVEYRAYHNSGSAPAFSGISNGGTFSIPASGPDGIWNVDSRANDPCNAFGAPKPQQFYLDATPPTITSPIANQVYDVNQFATLDWTATDTGSGIKPGSESVTVDGVPATKGQTLDMYYFAAGAHTVSVTASDNVDNVATTTFTFYVTPSIRGIIDATNRAAGRGTITPYPSPLDVQPALLSFLLTPLNAARNSENAGSAAGAKAYLQIYSDRVATGKRKGQIRPGFADRAMSWAADKISRL